MSVLGYVLSTLDVSYTPYDRNDITTVEVDTG